VYRLEWAREVVPGPDLLTGVSGIPPLSPALTVAAGRLAVSVYEDGN
jgi:hypothetical protein